MSKWEVIGMVLIGSVLTGWLGPVGLLIVCGWIALQFKKRGE